MRDVREVAVRWQELTPRESAVLAAVERRLTNAEIADEFQLSIRTVESHIAALRRKLGADNRPALIDAARSRRGTGVVLPDNSFVGRERDLAAVRGLLDRERWVTVVGPAGCGKTRLALEVAAGGPRVPLVVELEHATDRDVVAVVAAAVGVGAESGPERIAALGLAMDARSSLLVLDNADRVDATVADLVARLLATARSLRVLVTSRSPLGSAAEAVHQLTPLAVEQAAVELFCDRARTAVGGRLPFDPDNSLVRTVCDRMDGLPLAIELAAARLRHLSLAEVAARLADGFDALERAGPADRHRTLDAALDWSWDLLDDDERLVLRRLAALPGGFDLDLAVAVAGGGADTVVLRLLDRSFVATARTRSPQARFRLLDAVRYFVLARTQPKEVDASRAAHAAYVLERARDLDPRRHPVEPSEGEAVSRRLTPDLVAAVDWAVDRDLPHTLALAGCLSMFAEAYSPDLSAQDSLTRLGQNPRVLAVADVDALAALAEPLFYGDLSVAEQLAALALERAQDTREQMVAHRLAGYLEAYLYRPEAAVEHLRIAEDLAVELGDGRYVAMARMGVGIALRRPIADDPGPTIAAFEAALAAFAAVGDANMVDNVRYMMAATAADFQLPTEQALMWCEECVEFARRTGNRHGLAHALLTRARLRPDDHDVDLEETAATFRAIGDLRCLTRTYLELAEHGLADQQMAYLELALEVADQAHDPGHQARSLAGLVARHWAAGAERAAALAFGRLVALVGREEAEAAVPASMSGRLDELSTAIAEGQAQASAVR